MIIIEKATYGGINCLEQINNIVGYNSHIFILANNNIIGDPLVGIKKQLRITIDGKEYITDEGDFFTYPKSDKKKLGIWYTNNTESSFKPPIIKSLQTIEKSSKNKADIITCVWNRIQENKFIELLSWYKSTSHLNQLLQIMQCLVVAKNIGTYEYVSFLEHDVMYPENYFDFPDFDYGQVMTNMNYGGLNKYGWQEKRYNDQPMHQMTMRFSDAIEHTKNILDNALLTNSGNIENNTLVRKTWNCINQSIHINHGNHFTNHFSVVYNQNKNLPKYHKYWGDHKDYQHLLK
jgi:hypothetical protein